MHMLLVALKRYNALFAKRRDKGFKSLGLCQSDHGQMVAELVIVIPAFLVALVVATNIFMFISLNAKMDKVANEIASEIYQSPFNTAQDKNVLVTNALKKSGVKRLYAYVAYIPMPDDYIEGRYKVTVSVRWQPFKSAGFVKRAPFLAGFFIHRKSIYIATGEVMTRP